MKDSFDAETFCEFKTKLQNVCNALGSGWRPGETPFVDWLLRGTLISPEGAELFISYRFGKPWRISGCVPKDYLGGNPTKSINVGYDRDAKAVASEISRRLLPEYLAWFKQAKASCDANARREQVVNEAYAKFTALTGNPVNSYTKKIHTYAVDCRYKPSPERRAFIPGVPATIEVNADKDSPAEVSLTLTDLTVEESTAVLQFLRAGRLEAAAKANIRLVA
jgi:hypothetical protein